jgi:glycosyltransferase involved in cell wall biosynthesis
MIAFVQPFGLADQSGGARILRALLENAPRPFLSVCAAIDAPSPVPFGNEVHLPPIVRIPGVRGTRLAPLTYDVLLRPFSAYFARRFEAALEQTFIEYGASGVHAIPHGPQFVHAFEVAQRMGLPYVLNVHDDMRYNLAGRRGLDGLMDQFARIWREADDRIVISDAMGERYCEEFGKRSFQVVTDGLTEEMLSPARPRLDDNRLRLYFMGALHLSYHANFQQVGRALEMLDADPSAPTPSFVLRGSRLPEPLPRISVDHRPYGSEREVQQDLNSVDVLYFPLPFGEEYDAFTKYSMSTKLVTYLGAGLPIVYHGPAYSAAARLLAGADASLIIDSTDPRDVAEGIRTAHATRDRLVANAQHLARERFWLADQKHRLWSVLDVTPARHDRLRLPSHSLAN